MTLNNSVHEHNLKNKAKLNLKKQQVLCSIGLNNVAIYSRDGLF